MTEDLPEIVDLEGHVDEEQNIRYLSKAYRQPNGKYHVLADVSGALAQVEVTLSHTGSGSPTTSLGPDEMWVALDPTLSTADKLKATLAEHSWDDPVHGRIIELHHIEKLIEEL